MPSCCAAWPKSLESCGNRGAFLGWSTAPDPDGNEWGHRQLHSSSACPQLWAGSSVPAFTDFSGMGLLFWNRKFKWKIAVRCCQRALLTGERSHTIWQVKGISFIPDLEIYHKADCSFQWLHWLNFRVLGWGQAAASFTPQNGCHYSDGLSLCLTTPQGIKELVWCIWTESSEDL